MKREEIFQLGSGIRLGSSVCRAPACRAGELGSNPDPGENFSLSNWDLLILYHAVFDSSTLRMQTIGSGTGSTLIEEERSPTVWDLCSFSVVRNLGNH